MAIDITSTATYVKFEETGPTGTIGINMAKQKKLPRGFTSIELSTHGDYVDVIFVTGSLRLNYTDVTLAGAPVASIAALETALSSYFY